MPALLSKPNNLVFDIEQLKIKKHLKITQQLEVKQYLILASNFHYLAQQSQ